MTRPAHGCGVPTLRGLLPRGTPCVTVSDGPATRRSQKTGTTSGLLRAPRIGALAFLDAAGVRLADTETIDALRRGAPATRFGAAWRCCFHARLSHKPRRPRFLVEIEQTPPGGPSEISPVKPSNAVRSPHTTLVSNTPARDCVRRTTPVLYATASRESSSAHTAAS